MFLGTCDSLIVLLVDGRAHQSAFCVIEVENGGRERRRHIKETPLNRRCLLCLTWKAPQTEREGPHRLLRIRSYWHCCRASISPDTIQHGRYRKSAKDALTEETTQTGILQEVWMWVICYWMQRKTWMLYVCLQVSVCAEAARQNKKKALKRGLDGQLDCWTVKCWVQCVSTGHSSLDLHLQDVSCLICVKRS